MNAEALATLWRMRPEFTRMIGVRQGKGNASSQSNAVREALLAARSGNHRAFGLVYRAYFRKVFGLCLRLLRSHIEAEDAASEVFERAQRSLSQYDPERPFEPWLLRVASHHCLNRLRRRRTERRIFDDEPEEWGSSATQISPLGLCESKEQRLVLERALASLPEKQRIILVLRYFADLSYDEIAQQLDTNKNHIAVLLHRAKRELRSKMEECK